MKARFGSVLFVCVVAFQSCYCSMEAKRVLVFGGKTGWIGQKIVKALKEEHHFVFVARSR